MATKQRKKPQDYKVGAPDPTPSRGTPCGALNRRQFACTQRPGHPMPHIAGSGREILAVWFD